MNVLWVDSWTDGRQPSMRSQICLQNCHIPDQTLNFLSILTPLLREKRASVIGLPCAYFREGGVLLRLRIKGGSDLQKR